MCMKSQGTKSSQVRSVLQPTGSSGEQEERFNRNPLPVSLLRAESHREQFRQGQAGTFHSLMLSIQRFLCRPRRRPPCKVPCVHVKKCKHDLLLILIVSFVSLSAGKAICSRVALASQVGYLVPKFSGTSTDV